MNRQLKTTLCALWYVGIIIQQMCWLVYADYTIIALFVGIMEACLPYLVYIVFKK